jgi:hypothetical protein
MTLSQAQQRKILTAALPRKEGQSLKCVISALHFSQVREGVVGLSGIAMFLQHACSKLRPLVKFDQTRTGAAISRPSVRDYPFINQQS